jgi:hypothetical protein
VYQLSDDAFARLVSEDVKNRISSQQRKLLTERSNHDRWQRALVHLIDNLNQQLADANSDAAADARRYEDLGEDGADLAREASLHYATKVQKIERFKFHVERRLDEVSLMIATNQIVEQSDTGKEIEFLRRAISMHRSMLEEFDLEETAIDRALWAALENRWAFDDINESAI